MTLPNFFGRQAPVNENDGKEIRFGSGWELNWGHPGCETSMYLERFGGSGWVKVDLIMRWGLRLLNFY